MTLESYLRDALGPLSGNQEAVRDVQAVVKVGPYGVSLTFIGLDGRLFVVQGDRASTTIPPAGAPTMYENWTAGQVAQGLAFKARDAFKEGEVKDVSGVNQVGKSGTFAVFAVSMADGQAFEVVVSEVKR